MKRKSQFGAAFLKKPLGYQLARLRAWRDGFRTYEWEKAIPDPELTFSNISSLLALA